MGRRGKKKKKRKNKYKNQTPKVQKSRRSNWSEVESIAIDVFGGLYWSPSDDETSQKD